MHSNNNGTYLQEKNWLELWIGEKPWPQRAMLKVPSTSEESWWFSTMRLLVKHKAAQSATHVQLQRLDLSDLTSKNKIALKKLQELEQGSLFASGDLYYVLFPSILSKEIQELISRALSLSHESILLVNPPKKMMDHLPKLPPKLLLDLSLEKSWHKKDRMNAYAQALIKKFAAVCASKLDKLPVDQLSRKVKVNEGGAGASRPLNSETNTQSKTHKEKETGASLHQQEGIALSHLESCKQFFGHWPRIWSQIWDSLYSATSFSRITLQQECEKIALAIVEKSYSRAQNGQEFNAQFADEFVGICESELLFYPSEESVWEISSSILDGDHSIFHAIDSWLEKDPSAIMTASVLRKQWSQGLLWMASNQVPQALLRNPKKKQLMQTRWQKHAQVLPYALTIISSSIFALKDGAVPKIALEQLLAQLFYLCSSSQQTASSR